MAVLACLVAGCSETEPSIQPIKSEFVGNLFSIPEAPNPSYDNVVMVSFSARNGCIEATTDSGRYTPIFAGYVPEVTPAGVLTDEINGLVEFGRMIEVVGAFEGSATVNVSDCPEQTLVIPPFESHR